jgi:hypothetical protein
MAASAVLLALYTLCAAGILLVARWLRRDFDRTTKILFFLLPLAFLWQGVFCNRTQVPTDLVFQDIVPWNALPHPPAHNATLSDFATQFTPWAKAVRVAFKEGSLPFRNRWAGCGSALAGNGQSAAFSPFTILGFALPLARAFALSAAVKLLVALAGAWLWLSELKVSRAAARFGAVAFAFSFAFTPWLYHPAAAGISFWPWALFAAEYQEEPGRRRRLWLAIAIFLVWPLCGHLETVALGTLFLGLWIAVRAAFRQSRVPARAVGTLALGAVLGLALSGFWLVPHAYTVAASNRLVLARDPSHWAYVPWVPYKPGWLGGFVTSLFPRSFGDAIDSPMIAGAAGSMVEMGFGYFGIVGWGFALCLLRPGARRNRAEWALLLLAAFGFGAAMGLPPFRQLVDLLPGIRLGPPLRLLLFVSIAGSALAAFELDRFVLDSRGRRGAVMWLVAVCAALSAAAVLVFLRLRGLHEAAGGLESQTTALVVAVSALAATALVGAGFALMGRRLPGALALAVTALASAELLHQGMRLYRFSSPATLYPETPLLAFLRSQPRPFRVVGEGFALFPNTGAFPGLEDVRTHDPLERRDYVEFLDATAGYPPFEYFKRVGDLNAPSLDFLNVRFLIEGTGAVAPGPKWTPVYTGFDGKVFENRDVLPRIFAPPVIQVAPRASVERTGTRNTMSRFGDSLAEFLASPRFRDRALVLEIPDVPGKGPMTEDNARLLSASLAEETTNRIVWNVAIAGSRPVVLVSSYVNDGGWSASGPAGKIPTLLVNGPFLGLQVDPGRSRIQLDYLPPGMSAGLALTLAGLAGVAACAALRNRRAS